MRDKTKNTGRSYIWRKLVAAFVAFATLLAMVVVSGVASRQVAWAEDTAICGDNATNLTSGLTVGIYESEADRVAGTNPVSSTAEMDNGSTMYGQFTVNFTDDQRPTADKPCVAYVFPNGVKYTQTGATSTNDPMNLQDSNGEYAGWWRIVDNKLCFRYSEEYLNKHPDVKRAGAKFDFQLKDDDYRNKDQVDLNFPGTSTDLTIHVKKGDVAGSKSWKYDNTDDSVLFTIDLRPSDNKTKDFVLTDTMGKNLVFEEGSFALDGETVSDVTITTGEDGKQTAVIKLPDGSLTYLDNWQSHKLTYKAKLSDSAKAQLADGTSLSDVENNASWTFKDAPNPDKDKTSTNPDLKYSMVSKSASGSPSDITWTVKLNSGTVRADMGGYTFTDTLQNGHTYTGGTYTLKNMTTGTETTGPLPSGGNSFTFTLPSDAGKNEYQVIYHTKMTNVDSTEPVSNNVTIEHDGKKYSGTGTYNPPAKEDTHNYVTKERTSDPDENTGKVTWKSVVKLSEMPANTDPNSIMFTDDFTGPSGSTVQTVFSSVTVKIGDTVLTPDTENWKKDGDYSFSSYNTHFQIDFHGDKVKNAIGNTDAVITYSTTCNMAGGTYTNTSTVNKGHSSASATYEVAKYVKKNGSAKWDPNFDWTNVDNTTGKGAWNAEWTVTVNGTDTYGVPAVPIDNSDVVVDDVLPYGMVYVPNSAKFTILGSSPRYDVSSGNSGLSVEVSGRKVTFTIPSALISEVDKDRKAIIIVKYQTVAKNIAVPVNGSGKFTNHASASAGSTKFGDAESTINVEDKTVTKSSDYASENQRGNIKYTIKVNETGRQLLPTAEGSLVLEDVLDPNASLVGSTLMILSPDGAAIKGTSYSLENVTTTDGQQTVKMTLVIPDSTPAVVTYEVAPLGDENSNVTLSNTVAVKGHTGWSSTDNKSYTIHHADGWTETEAGTIEIYKSDSEDSSRRLEGAEFTLYRVDLSQQSVSEPNFVDKGKTDAFGKVVFGSSQHLSVNTLYYFCETEAPTFTEKDGKVTHYKVDPTRHYFILKGTDTNEYNSIVQLAKEHGINPSSFTAYTVYDERKPDSAELPSTGGMGDGWFVAGGALTVLVACFGLAETRKNAKRGKSLQL